jgi:hypothetical protein
LHDAIAEGDQHDKRWRFLNEGTYPKGPTSVGGSGGVARRGALVRLLRHRLLLLLLLVNGCCGTREHYSRREEMRVMSLLLWVCARGRGETEARMWKEQQINSHDE